MWLKKNSKVLVLAALLAAVTYAWFTEQTRSSGTDEPPADLMSSLPKMVELYAPGCPSCRAMEPLLEHLKEKCVHQGVGVEIVWVVSALVGQEPYPTEVFQGVLPVCFGETLQVIGEALYDRGLGDRVDGGFVCRTVEEAQDAEDVHLGLALALGLPPRHDAPGVASLLLGNLQVGNLIRMGDVMPRYLVQIGAEEVQGQGVAAEVPRGLLELLVGTSHSLDAKEGSSRFR